MSNSRLPSDFLALIQTSVRGENNKRSRFVFIFGITLAAVLLYLALRGLDWPQFIETLKNARYTYLPLVLVWGSLGYFIRALRWRVLLTAEKPISPVDVFWANMAGYLGNNILPARAGELIRAMYVSRQNNVTAPFALATGLVERFIDLITLIILGSVSLSVSDILSKPMQDALTAMSIIGGVGLIAIVLLPYIGYWMDQVIASLPLLTASAKEKLSELLKQFLHGIEALHSAKRIGVFLLFTATIWLMDGIGTLFLGYILNLHLSLSQAFVLLAGLGLSSAIPSTPGYVGVYQFVAVTVLVPFGYSRANALAFILISQILNYLIISFWGLLGLWQINKSNRGV